MSLSVVLGFSLFAVICTYVSLPCRYGALVLPFGNSCVYLSRHVLLPYAFASLFRLICSSSSSCAFLHFSVINSSCLCVFLLSSWFVVSLSCPGPKVPNGCRFVGRFCCHAFFNFVPWSAELITACLRLRLFFSCSLLRFSILSALVSRGSCLALILCHSVCWLKTSCCYAFVGLVRFFLWCSSSAVGLSQAGWTNGVSRAPCPASGG